MSSHSLMEKSTCPPCVPSFSLRIQGEPVDWFAAEHRSRWSKSCTSVEVLGVRIIWMDGEMERLALRMMAPDELKNQETSSAMRSVPRISPLMLHELTQRYKRHK